MGSYFDDMFADRSDCKLKANMPKEGGVVSSRLRYRIPVSFLYIRYISLICSHIQKKHSYSSIITLTKAFIACCSSVKKISFLLKIERGLGINFFHHV